MADEQTGDAANAITPPKKGIRKLVRLMQTSASDSSIHKLVELGKKLEFIKEQQATSKRKGDEGEKQYRILRIEKEKRRKRKPRKEKTLKHNVHCVWRIKWNLMEKFYKNCAKIPTATKSSVSLSNRRQLLNSL